MERGIWEHQVCSQWCKPTPFTGETMVAEMRHLLTRDTLPLVMRGVYLCFPENTQYLRTLSTLVNTSGLLKKKKKPTYKCVSASVNQHPHSLNTRGFFIPPPNSSLAFVAWCFQPQYSNRIRLLLPNCASSKVSLGRECRPGALLASSLVFESSSAAPRHCGSKETSGVEI